MTFSTVILAFALAADGGATAPATGDAAPTTVDASAAPASDAAAMNADGGVPDGADTPAPPPAPAPPPVGRLTGRVVAKGTRAPIGGAHVTVDVSPAGESDERGDFSVEVPCGPRHLLVQAPGYEALTTIADACAGASEPLTLRITPASDGPAYVTVVRVKPAQPQVHLAAEEARQTPGTLGDPLRVIESLPGVATVAWPAPIYAVRGSNPGNTGFFLDGIRIPALFHLALGPSVIHPYFFGGLDFYPGGYPARFGRYAAGIVAAETRSPAEDRVHGAADVRLFDAGGMMSAPLPGGGTLAVAARYSYTAGLVSLLNEDLRLGYWDYQVRADRRVGPVQLTLLAFGSHDALAPKDDANKELNLRFHRVSLRASVPVGGGRAQASLALGADHSKSPIAETSVPVTVDAVSAAPRLSYQRSFPAVDTAVGFDGELTHYRPITTIVRPVSDWDLGSARTAVLLAGYASATIRAGRLTLTPELRYDSYQVSGVRSGDLGPRLTVHLKLRDDLALKATGGRFTQMPSLPLQIPGADGFGLRLLGLQSSWQTSLGVETTRVPGLELAVTGYVQRYVLSDLRDLTQDRPDPLDQDLLVRRDGLSYGVEVLARRPPRLPLYGWISYTLSNNRRALGGGAIGPSDWDQRHIFNLVSGYRIGRTTLGGRVHLNTGRPYVVQDAMTNEFQRLPTFYQVDLRVDRHIIFDTFTLDFYAELVNATLTRQVYSYHVSGPGQIKESGIRLVLPSVGVRGEF